MLRSMNMKHSVFWTNRRLAGIFFLVGVLLFGSGTATSISLVDARGTSMFLLPPQQGLRVIAAHSLLWQWMLILAFRLSVSLWAAQATTKAVLSDFYEPLYLWADVLLFTISIILAFCALAAYAAGLLATSAVPRW